MRGSARSRPSLCLGRGPNLNSLTPPPLPCPPPCSLSPADCHRLHAPVAGRVASVARRGDKFMASLWVAVHSSLDVMVENERLVMAFDSDALGPVVMVRGAARRGAATAAGGLHAYFWMGGCRGRRLSALLPPDVSDPSETKTSPPFP